jgi:RimJ/RimL family protein N-acetyltransferase
MSTHENRSSRRSLVAVDRTGLLPSCGYPADLIEVLELSNGKHVTLRPVLPLDAPKYQAFVRNLSATSRHQRFLHGLNELPPNILEMLTRIDYRNHLALIAEAGSNGMSSIIAEARYVVIADGDRAELAMVVADEWQGLGLAKAMLQRLRDRARTAGVSRLTGEVLASNERMLRLARKAGFGIRRNPEAASMLRIEAPILDGEPT